MTATMSEGGLAVRLRVATEAGGMTALVRDVLIPLMTTVELAP